MAYVIDTSALVSLFLDEHGADVIQEILDGGGDLLLPFMTLMELRYVLARRFPGERVNDIIETLLATGAQVVESSREWGVAAAGIKSHGGLSVADAWIASLALLHDAELVHKDPEFDSMPDLRARKLR